VCRSGLKPGVGKKKSGRKEVDKWGLQLIYYKKRRNTERIAERGEGAGAPIFSRFFLSRFWAFLGDGSSKTR
jgi:hypothetical protein